MRTVGPLALNDRLRALSRAAASLEPGLAERLGLRPEVAVRFSGDAQVSCQIEGSSEDLCINDRAGIIVSRAGLPPVRK